MNRYIVGVIPCYKLQVGNVFSISETNNKGFSKDVCRSMVAMLDTDHSGKLGFEEFKTLWNDIRKWRVYRSITFNHCLQFSNKNQRNMCNTYKNK